MTEWLSDGMVQLMFLCGFIPGAIAFLKGRHFLRWWIFGTLLFPPALIAALLVSRRRICRQCRARLDPAATRCRHCGGDPS